MLRPDAAPIAIDDIYVQWIVPAAEPPEDVVGMLCAELEPRPGQPRFLALIFIDRADRAGFTLNTFAAGVRDILADYCAGNRTGWFVADSGDHEYTHLSAIERPVVPDAVPPEWVDG